MAMGNDPVNFLDPWGLDIINVFRNFDPSRSDYPLRLLVQARIDNRVLHDETFYSPDWDELRRFAEERGHVLNIIDQGDEIVINNVLNFMTGNWSQINFSSISRLDLVKQSLSQEDTWTFLIGHSIHDASGRFYGALIAAGQEFYRPIISRNRNVGIFGCHSSAYASNLIYGLNTNLFSVDPRGTQTTEILNMERAAHRTIESIISGYSPTEVAQRGTEALREIGRRERAVFARYGEYRRGVDIEDDVVFEERNRTQLLSYISNLIGGLRWR
jgi:hypothetical protein